MDKRPGGEDLNRFLSPDWASSQGVLAFSSIRGAEADSGPYARLNYALHVGDDPAAVANNRAALMAALGPQYQGQWLEQVHGNGVAVVSQAGPDLAADGLVTTQAGLLLCIMTADCLPVLLAAPGGQVIGAAHAGWRGMAAGVIENTVAAMTEISGLPASEFTAWLAPAIGQCHFEVGEEVRDAFTEAKKGGVDIHAAFKPAAGGKYHADLAMLATGILGSCGVTGISGCGLCTACEPDRFFSHRRSAPCGRMVSGIAIQPES